MFVNIVFNSKQVFYSYSIGFVYILIGQVLTAQLWEAFAFCLKVSISTAVLFLINYNILCLFE